MRNFGAILLLLGILGFFYASSRIDEIGPLPDGALGQRGAEGAGGPLGDGALRLRRRAAGFGLLMALFPKGR